MTTIMTMLRSILCTRLSIFKSFLNMLNFCLVTQNFLSSLLMVFPSAIFHLSIAHSLLPTSLVPTFMQIRFVLILLRSSDLAASQGPSHEKSWNSRLGSSVHHLCKWLRRKAHRVNQPSTVYASTSRTKAEPNPLSMTRSTQTNTPCAGEKKLMLQKSYVYLISSSRLLPFSFLFHLIHLVCS